jgi:hypothetical protein
MANLKCRRTGNERGFFLRVKVRSVEETPAQAELERGTLVSSSGYVGYFRQRLAELTAKAKTSYISPYDYRLPYCTV